MNDQKLEAAARLFRIRLLVKKPVDQRKTGGDQQPDQQLFGKWSFSVWEWLAHELFVVGKSRLE